MKRNLIYPSTDVLDAVENGRALEANPKCVTGENAATTRRTTVAAVERLVFITCLVASAFVVFYFRNPTKDLHDTLRFLQYTGPPSGYAPPSAGGIYGGQPSKGNTDCSDLPLYYGEPGRNPCHYDGSTLPPSNGDGNDRFPPSFVPSNDTDADFVGPSTEGSNVVGGNPFLPQPPTNIVNLTVYVAQDPQTPSVAHRVAMILSDEMNKTIENMVFYIRKGVLPGALPDDELFEEVLDGEEGAIFIETQQVNNGNPNGEGGGPSESTVDNPNWGEPQGPGEGGGGGTGPSKLVVDNPNRGEFQGAGEGGGPSELIPGGDGNGAIENPRRDTPRENRFDMIYIRTSSTVALQEPGVRWWWQLDIFYLCLWKNGDPVGAKVMNAIRVNMTDSIREKIDEIQSLVRNDTKREELLLGLDILEIPNDIPKDMNDTAVLGASSVTPLDVGEWSWTRYLGFVVFLSTCSGLIFTSQVGAIRRRRKVRHQVWGNLASEEGVKELLNTGWILRDDRMEVYDKARVGYRDDDSMLIGGFEQREPGPGTEIITPTLTTHEETSTRGPSTAPRPVSTRHEDP